MKIEVHGAEVAVTQWTGRPRRSATQDAVDCVLVTRPPGYRLQTEYYHCDMDEFTAAVRHAAALSAAGTPPLVMCHISHVYPAGASLYFTVVSAQGDDPVAHWAPAKRAANDAIETHGGTISHHHGVGTDHRDWYAREIGPLGVAVLRAVKAELDPAGILNPGVLLPS